MEIESRATAFYLHNAKIIFRVETNSKAVFFDRLNFCSTPIDSHVGVVLTEIVDSLSVGCHQTQLV